MEKVAVLCGIEKRYGYSWRNVDSKVQSRREECFTNLVYSTGKYIWPYESVHEFVGLCGYQCFSAEINLLHSVPQKDGMNFPEKYVVFAMDTTNNMREWPIEKFGQLGERYGRI